MSKFKNLYNSLPKPEKNIFVYLLSDPDTNEPRYIGITTVGFTRLTQHYNDCFKKNKTKMYSRNWIQSLRKQNKIFKVDYLEYFNEDSNEIDEAEQFYISYFKFLGFKLLNHENGGRWNGYLTKDQKKQISDRVKIQMSSEKTRKFLSDINIGNKNCLGRKNSKETKDKIRKNVSNVIQEINTGLVFYGASELGKYLNCSKSKAFSKYSKNDEFEIEGKKFKVIQRKEYNFPDRIEKARKHSYQIEDEFGNLYTSIKEAAEKIGCSNRALTHYVQGSCKTANGKKYKVYRYGQLIKG